MLMPIVLLCYSLMKFVSSEDPFCGNKCYDTGVMTNRNCFCDQDCSYPFNDCCGDSEYVSTSQLGNRKLMSCEKLSKGKYTPMVKTCPKDWKGPDAIRQSCSSSFSPFQDPFGSTPITNPSSGITYGSFYCAICNDDAVSMFFWNLRVVCPTLDKNLGITSEEILKYIHYNKLMQQWGFSVREDFKGSDVFHGCDVRYIPPDQVASKVRQCEPGEVGHCAESWKQDTIRLMCGAYTDPVFANNTRYKNFYCALCNYVDQSTLSCGSAVGPRYDSVPDDAESPNFALLLDVNFSDGNRVGKRSSSSCGEGEVYDPFKKTCRNIVCGLPGYHVKDGKCSQN